MCGVINEGACLFNEGIYQGDGTTCDPPDPCATPTPTTTPTPTLTPTSTPDPGDGGEGPNPDSCSNGEDDDDDGDFDCEDADCENSLGCQGEGRPLVIVPTMTEWGMIFVTIILGVLVVIGLRRKGSQDT